MLPHLLQDNYNRLLLLEVLGFTPKILSNKCKQVQPLCDCPAFPVKKAEDTFQGKLYVGMAVRRRSQDIYGRQMRHGQQPPPPQGPQELPGENW